MLVLHEHVSQIPDRATGNVSDELMLHVFIHDLTSVGTARHD